MVPGIRCEGIGQFSHADTKLINNEVPCDTEMTINVYFKTRFIIVQIHCKLKCCIYAVPTGLSSIGGQILLFDPVLSPTTTSCDFMQSASTWVQHSAEL